jgi:hypothetical protein
MPQSGLSAEVSAFLEAYIDSVPQMEALLLLYEERGNSWSAAQIATRIYTDTAQVTSLLRHLQQQRLIEPVPGEDSRFRYDASWDTNGMMEQVATAYRTQLIAVTRLIHGKASRSVLDFARAFDLKKDR